MKAKELASLCRSYRTTSKGFLAICPVHKSGEERSPSLSITQTDHQILLHCYAGCTWREIVAKLNLAPGDLFDDDYEAHERHYTRDAAEEDALVVLIHRGAVKRREKISKADEKFVLEKAKRLFKNGYRLSQKGELQYERCINPQGND